ncbi:MAG: MFS transporter, partial [Thermomicrobia bacterium]|nr:MFS transporter [Thermomicrobia bacterium]
MARTETAPASNSSLRVLGQRNFGPYFLGNLLSNCGTWFQNIAQALLIYRLTHSTFLVGVVSFAQFAGIIFLAPWSGGAADRFDRKRLIIATQIGSMIVTGALALLAVAGWDTVPVIIGLALLLGLVTAFGSPAMNAIVPSLVSRDDLGAAIAMNSVTFNMARAVGPVLGALVVARFGIAWAFGINCLSYAALIGALLIVHPRQQAERPKARPKLGDSFAIIRQDLRLAALLGVVASVSFALDPVTTLAPAFATQVFHHSDTLAGYLIGAFGTGAVIAAVFATGRSETPYRRITIMLTLLAAGIATYAFLSPLVLAFGALGVAGWDTVPVIIGLALLLGLVTAFGSPAMNAIVPSLVSRDDLGAAIAMNSVTFNMARAVGPVLGALVVARFGIAWAFGINCLSYAALIGALLIIHPRQQAERPKARPKLGDSFAIIRQDLRLAALLG